MISEDWRRSAESQIGDLSANDPEVSPAMCDVVAASIWCRAGRAARMVHGLLPSMPKGDLQWRVDVLVQPEEIWATGLWLRLSALLVLGGAAPDSRDSEGE